jgi:hypothetical protein
VTPQSSGSGEVLPPHKGAMIDSPANKTVRIQTPLDDLLSGRRQGILKILQLNTALAHYEPLLVTNIGGLPSCMEYSGLVVEASAASEISMGA